MPKRSQLSSSYPGDRYPEPSLKSTMDSYDMASSSTNDTSPSVFSIFHEDILLNILSYVADVPYEMNSNGMLCYCLQFYLLDFVHMICL